MGSSQTGQILSWDIGTGRQSGSLSGNEKSVWALSFAPDAPYMVAAGGSEGIINIWENPSLSQIDLNTKQVSRPLSTRIAKQSSIYGLRFTTNYELFSAGASTSEI